MKIEDVNVNLLIKEIIRIEHDSVMEDLEECTCEYTELEMYQKFYHFVGKLLKCNSYEEIMKKSKCSNCDGMVLELDETCAVCGR